MSIVKFPEPIKWEDEIYSEVDPDLVKRLKGKDKLAIMRRLRAKKQNIMQPETDERYLLAVLSKVSGIPEEAFGELPIAVFTQLQLEVQGSLLGSEDGGQTPSES